MTEIISSLHNPMVKILRSLAKRKVRDESGLFLVEGIYPVGEVIAADWNLEALVYCPELLRSDFGKNLIREQSLHGVRCMALSRDLFISLAGKDNPQGILAVVHQKHFSLDQVTGDIFSFGAAIVSAQDPGNVGTILRTLDAIGADGLFLLEGGVELFHPSVIRASMGTLFWKYVVQASFQDFLHWKKSNRIYLIGSSAHAAIDYRTLNLPDQPTILLLGNEQKGLTDEQTEACDVVVSIKMEGRVSSLNLAVAAGILLYQMVENKKGRHQVQPRLLNSNR